MNDSVEFVHIESDADCLACFAVMQQLRPKLEDPHAFVQQIQRQRETGYRLLAARENGQVLGLAGYRLTENLLYGRFIYVDDLVVDASLQRRRLGARLLDEVRQHTRRLGYRYLVLDTGMHMALAQRFYFRQGLLPLGMHFSQDLDQ
ncbi:MULTISPECIES: GNAT family N-acetyltransferase [unclassified Pseudomonas]|jgi:ribosomal protein S18 acetylase RimI-like enzyme|uniref:GNAT family N-acetyltransferase n=1 Tax=unclassified Pseudomonas TaxID=196821 RepID=UPI000B4047DB|nr:MULTISPECIES: GNAT family N-acetyltransferase [unclassified Pseudomonas]MDQ0667922.1 ribosomal protein S18 acetylase RimI-like enzyme [Pseudomonas sp. W2I6]NVZ13252.1 GNAT family N-acetyltransferase [Pseudomonas sp. IPO3775]NVZ32458.1 GNAT family N-acetyltransferase [Pseudomonas sp. A4002]NVZ39236.1 GNAT family N-acetyltransferase [Pseudomonas sp. 21615526]NWA77231.1 GNAT family N-acetyltransferase [Pseudomonas sp. C8002]